MQPDHGHTAGHSPGHGPVTTDPGAHGDPAPGSVAPDVVRAGFVFGWGLGLFFAVVVIIIALGGYFWWERDREVEVKVAGVGGTRLQALRATEQGRLTSYAKLPDGRYQIPIDRAIELVVRDGL